MQPPANSTALRLLDANATTRSAGPVQSNADADQAAILPPPTTSTRLDRAADPATLTEAITELRAICAAITNLAQAATTVKPLQVGNPIAAHMSGVSISTWERLVASGKTPAPTRLGGRVFFNVAELELWLAMKCPPRVEFESRLKPPSTVRATASGAGAKTANRPGPAKGQPPNRVFLGVES